MALRLAFEATGTGPPVLILHGLFASSRNWRTVAHALAPEYRVLCVDLRNHGRSPWTGSMSYREMADDVRMLLDAEGFEEPAVIGHCTGGKVAMALALEHPESVGQLVIVDIASVLYVDSLVPYVEAMRDPRSRSMTKRADARWPDDEKVPDAATVALLRRHLAARCDHFDWRLNFEAIPTAVPTLSGFPHEFLLRTYRGPTTLIHGSLSDYVRSPDRARLAEPFPRMRTVEIEGAGHWVHVDRPDQFLAAITCCLQSSPSTGCTGRLRRKNPSATRHSTALLSDARSAVPSLANQPDPE